VHHFFLQFVLGFNDAGGIRKDDLVLRFGSNAFDAVAGSLHLGGNNSQLFAHQSVEQGAFARVGASEYANKTRFHQF